MLPATTTQPPKPQLAAAINTSLPSTVIVSPDSWPVLLTHRRRLPEGAMSTRKGNTRALHDRFAYHVRRHKLLGSKGRVWPVRCSVRASSASLPSASGDEANAVCHWRSAASSSISHAPSASCSGSGSRAASANALSRSSLIAHSNPLTDTDPPSIPPRDHCRSSSLAIALTISVLRLTPSRSALRSAWECMLFGSRSRRLPL